MSQPFTVNLLRILSVACLAVLFVMPAHAFTANSLDITIDTSGDAVATFKFTLEGFLENAIPQSMLEEELKKGLTTSTEPPQLLSSDKSGATMILKKFAEKRDVEHGWEYRTVSMDFQKAEIALKNSALNGAVTADFSPAKITVTFPDAYTKTFENTAVLPSLTHMVIDPAKPAATATPAKTGTINVTTSPAGVRVSIDGAYSGESPGDFSDISAGTHTVLLEKEGFIPVTKTVTVVTGRTTGVIASLQYKVQPTTTPAGILPLPGFGPVIVCLAVGSVLIIRKNFP
jgi:hypothetical protein